MSRDAEAEGVAFHSPVQLVAQLVSQQQLRSEATSAALEAWRESAPAGGEDAEGEDAAALRQRLAATEAELAAARLNASRYQELYGDAMMRVEQLEADAAAANATANATTPAAARMDAARSGELTATLTQPTALMLSGNASADAGLVALVQQLGGRCELLTAGRRTHSGGCR